jgi:hypothetical protein
VTFIHPPSLLDKQLSSLAVAVRPSGDWQPLAFFRDGNYQAALGGFLQKRLNE